MTCSTLSTSTAYCSTERQLRSVCTTTLATLRCTNTSPGMSPTISLAGTRLSAQPIQRYLGDCWAARRLKKSGCLRVTPSAQARLLANSCGSLSIIHPHESEAARSLIARGTGSITEGPQEDSRPGIRSQGPIDGVGPVLGRGAGDRRTDRAIL